VGLVLTAEVLEGIDRDVRPTQTNSKQFRQFEGLVLQGFVVGQIPERAFRSVGKCAAFCGCDSVATVV
jgi:hypothetical protein